MMKIKARRFFWIKNDQKKSSRFFVANNSNRKPCLLVTTITYFNYFSDIQVNRNKTLLQKILKNFVRELIADSKGLGVCFFKLLPI